ncbi:ComEC/Rec2 family competence protein, partial [Petrotoga sp. 9PW.55.5.1]|uniref:ComEC/Rec2 family competence protein n=1 Tax=Petrotoga sp. 9PW.55.5.1 TaxID=1308979 RepID=UPI0011BCF88E
MLILNLGVKNIRIHSKNAFPFFIELFLSFALLLLLSFINKVLVIVGFILILFSLWLVERDNLKVFLIGIFLLPSLFYTPIVPNSEVGILGKVIDKRGNYYTVFSNKLYFEDDWHTYRNYYKFYYGQYSTVPITTGKDVYIHGQIQDNFLKADYVAPSYNKSIMIIKDLSINALNEKIENQEARDLLISSLMGGIRDKEVFQSTGTLHLFAVSGMHVYIIYSIISFFLNFIILKRNARLVINSTFLVFYLIFTGFTPSSVRAVLLLVTLNLFRLFDIPVNSFNILGLIGYLNLLVIPNNLLNVSFQMSYAAAFMILFTTNQIDNRNLKSLSVPIAAYIGIFPIALIYFGEISLIGLFITPLLSPAISMLIICSISSIILPFEFIHSFSTVFALSIKNFVKLFTFLEPFKFDSILIPLIIWGIVFLLYVLLLQKNKKGPLSIEAF